MKVYLPIISTGVLYINGEGVYDVVLLKFIKCIKDCIGLPILFQKFFKVTFGINSGQLTRCYKRLNINYSKRINHSDYIP